MKHSLSFLVIAVILSLSPALYAIDTTEDVDIDKVFKKRILDENGHYLKYRAVFPKNYDPTKKYPLLIFLHGLGDRGDDNTRQILGIQDWVINNFYEDYPTIVLIPQCPKHSFWCNVRRSFRNGKAEFFFPRSSPPNLTVKSLIYLIEEWANSDLVEKDRIYIAGISLGGMGTLEVLWRRPELFAGAVSICGAANSGNIPYAETTSLWIFHGAADDTIDVKYVRELYDSLRSVGADVRYTEGENTAHDAWNLAFPNKELIPWLLSKRNRYRQ